ncbi:PepSY domain-containing protein, partial [Pseudomonas sp.]|uniref:PepSY domain-containing protein n=1 Tax=Pseudomonas sp. TaxID=306 RepID=UPI003D700D6D
AKHPGAIITDTELDHKNGVLVYEVDVTDTTGKKFDVKLDAKTGNVLEDKQDT